MTRLIAPDDRFHSLVAIKRVAGPQRGEHWLCRCDCGTEKIIYAAHLRAGTTKGCGCQRRHNNRRHGMAGSPEYKAWEGARARCQNPKHKKFRLYGGRGIKMCARWLTSFENFISDMGRKPSPAHSLDRYPDGDGDYEPGNCRWATIFEQNNNRSLNRHLIVDGQRMTIAEAAAISGLPHGTISSRLDRGKSDEEATKPCRGR